MNDTANKHLFGRSDIDQKNHYHKTTASEETVLSVLKSSPEVDISGIKVYVYDHEIHLQGIVDSIQSKRMIENLIFNYFEEKLVSRLDIKLDQDQSNRPH